jgi:hypothetical protein
MLPQEASSPFETIAPPVSRQRASSDPQRILSSETEEEKRLESENKP